jgi:D-aminoacyl-tRNA deacylase
MACLIYSADQGTSARIAEALKSILQFEDAGVVDGMKSFKSGSTRMLEVHGGITEVDFVDSSIGEDFAVFLSMHSSERGVAAFTVHAEGNWGDDARLGGKPKRLSTSSPLNMLSMLNAVKRSQNRLPVTYEATHHGPLLDAPSFFVEVGGTAQATSSGELSNTLAGAVADFLSADKEHSGKVAIGIGGTHYPEKFTRLALEGRYAFSHIMPKYNFHTDMLQQAVERSDIIAEVAVVEWKSFKSEERAGLLKELERIGVDYEKV